MKKRTVYLPVPLQQALEEAARAEMKPQTELVRAALEEYLGRERRPSLSSLGSGSDYKRWIEAEWGMP